MEYLRCHYYGDDRCSGKRDVSFDRLGRYGREIVDIRGIFHYDAEGRFSEIGDDDLDGEGFLRLNKARTGDEGVEVEFFNNGKRRSFIVPLTELEIR